ncbi:restriction endonuclease subunit S [Methanosarcina hadiensis]|uniref:restriction endonuclease subunit S n=1 Tax=Methanosarcina hadiensis TaxID=3078083 RepID=UPI0039772905
MSAECSAIDIPPGYKQTEVGVIPEDWKLTDLSSVCKEPMQNGVFYKPSLKGVGIKLINVGDLYTQPPIDSDKLELFNASDKERERFKVEDGDLFFTRSSVVPSGIAHCNIYRAPEPEPVVFDSHVIRLRPDIAKVVPLYLFRFCVATIARHYLVSHAKTATMTTIDQGVLGKCPVILPPIDEQESIAKALSDTDALIESLEQLTAKKRQIKQGAMQELLTGKRRLPGFATKAGYKRTEIGVIPKDWLDYTVGELIDFEGGSQPDKRTFIFTSKLGYVRLIQIRDYKTDKYETYVPTSLARRFCTKSDIMIGRYGPPIFQILRGLSGAYNVALIKAKPRPQINLTYAYYFLKQDSLFEFIDKLSQRSSGQTGVDLKELRNYPLSLPPTKDEQEAIATILSDMDSEITALEEKLAKARQIKQGMMQELLTGRVRLI